MILEPGDIFLTRGYSFVSNGIRFFTRLGGESRSMVNHVGIVVKGGTTEDAVVVEALTTVKRRKLSAYRGSVDTDVAVYRPNGLTQRQMRKVVARAEDYVGAKYGYFKIVAHFLDWCLGGAYVFRRLARMDKYPICSWVVAYAYDAAGVSFGVPPYAADPDHIWDAIINNPEWLCVHELGTLY